MTTRMGFEGTILYGTAGSTAATAITNSRDINYNIDPEKGDTTVRGDGVLVPIGTERVVKLGITIDWTMLHKNDDATLEALRVAAATGAAVAVRTLDEAAGKGFDGDVTLAVRHGKPIGGEQTLVFTASPEGETRTPVLYT